MARHSVFLALLLSTLAVGSFGCDTKPKPYSSPSFNPRDVEFFDEVESNREDAAAVTELEFVDTEGEAVRLADYVGDKNVLLVFTRGFSGQLCPYCTTQTSRLIANYEEFTKRNTEVLLVYPGQKGQIESFRQASLAGSAKSSFPFPVLLDEDLAAVKRLDIAAQVAFPSSFIIDKQGRVALSYVGRDPSDRPSIKALLAQLDSLQ